MQIVEFTKERLDACAALFTTVFNGVPWNESWNDSDSRMRIADIFAAPKCIGHVAQQNDGAVEGFVVGNLIRIESNDIFELKEMCVGATQQRRGIGSQLLTALEVILVARDVDSIFLQTSHETPAYDFYLKNGFVKDAHFSALTRKVK